MSHIVSEVVVLLTLLLLCTAIQGQFTPDSNALDDKCFFGIIATDSNGKDSWCLAGQCTEIEPRVSWAMRALHPSSRRDGQHIKLIPRGSRDSIYQHLYNGSMPSTLDYDGIHVQEYGPMWDGRYHRLARWRDTDVADFTSLNLMRLEGYVTPFFLKCEHLFETDARITDVDGKRVPFRFRIGRFESVSDE